MARAAAAVASSIMVSISRIACLSITSGSSNRSTRSFRFAAMMSPMRRNSRMEQSPLGKSLRVNAGRAAGRSIRAAASCQVTAEMPSMAAAIWATSSSARDAGAPVNLARWIIDTSSRTHARVPIRSS